MDMEQSGEILLKVMEQIGRDICSSVIMIKITRKVKQFHKNLQCAHAAGVTGHVTSLVDPRTISWIRDMGHAEFV